ncbi:MAG: ATP synthase F0 subunit B [Deltaproteobacteria bacterium]|jgi:F-type H+-transporting ATPase subunit b|nr:ATP synthase F0 subunit B [Deltaproteobacteria bacterium]
MIKPPVFILTLMVASFLLTALLALAPVDPALAAAGDDPSFDTLVTEDAEKGFDALAAEGEKIGYDPKQWRDFIWRAINFVVFVGILFFLLRKPVGAFFRGRQENIARTLEYLETQNKNLEESNGAMRRQLAELTAEREAILAQYERDGTRERDRIIAEAQKAAERIIQKTEVAMAQELLMARRGLAAETGALVVKMAGELISRNIQPEDQARLSHEFMEGVIRLPARKH